MIYNTHTLKNGIRLIHSPSEGQIAYCGLIVNAGSRDEKENQHGLAHYLEHAIFKGTTKRRSFHILNRLENVGGDINAFTTKEETCVYTAFLKEHYSRSFELISDIVFNSTFPEKEIDKEKEVIIDEINSYKDSPSELIFDEFEDLIFKNQPLGRNILGQAENIRKYKREDLIKFRDENYTTDRIVIFSLGNISFQRLVNLAEKYFGHIVEKSTDSKQNSKTIYQPQKLILNKNFHQLHAIIGNTAYDVWDKRRTALSFLNNLLGGSSMNSRLSMALRERNGFVYDIESNYTSYSDTGVFNIYFGTEKEKFEKSVNLIYKEFTKLKEKKLGVLQLSRAKQQLMGQIAIGMDNKESVAYSLGRSYLLFNKVDSLEEIAKKIDAITANEVMEISNEILDESKLSHLVYR
ncbi:MAG: insulinase family protein [Bacteroidetes bacterium]|nr:MAG: insulinase family protein [Bacteroidota bacterium]